MPPSVHRVIAFNDRVGRSSARRSPRSSVTTACRFDDNAVYNTTFTLTDISKVDYFHPSVAGQAKLAAVAYSAFGFPTG